MDKLAYHFNKKKIPAKTEGKYKYYYPCLLKEEADEQYGDNYYIVTEVSESEWESLLELDRLEYNNTHKFTRHSSTMPSANEDRLSVKQQQKRISDDDSLEEVLEQTADENNLRNAALNEKEQSIITLYRNGYTQAEIAEKTGVTQGYVSSAIKRINSKIENEFIKNATPDEIVSYYWEIFMNKGELTNYLDVGIEFVIRSIWQDLLPFLYSFYSVGELCRYTLKYYLFNNETMRSDIEKYLESATESERNHYNEYYKEKPEIIGAVFVRLTNESKLRQATGFKSSGKFYSGLYYTLEKITNRLHITPYEFLTERLYPFVANWRNKRLTNFYKYYKK